jgi:peptide/nickel transport system permease protein
MTGIEQPLNMTGNEQPVEPVVAGAFDVASPVVPPRRRSVFRRVLRDPFAAAGLALLLLVVVLALFAPVIASYDPEKLYVGEKWESPSAEHWLGTDHLGRDNASRIIYGAQVTVRVVLQVVVTTLVLAVPLGLVAGLVGRWIDTVITRAMDAIHAVPTLMLGLTFAGLSSLSFGWALFGISLALTPTMVRLVRAQTLAVREETFIEASIAIGTPKHRMLRKRVLPNIASPIIVQSSVYVGYAVLAEASLSVLGVGVRPGSAAWGSMLEEAFASIYSNSANVIIPGVAITLTVLGANMLGDGLRDAIGLDTGHRYGVKTRMGVTLSSHRSDRRSAPAPDVRPADHVLEVEDLSVHVTTERGRFQVLDGVSFGLGRGEVLGLVGESGSGKTVTAMSIMRLLPSPPFAVTGGEIRLDGEDLLGALVQRMRQVRGRDIAMIFQDPMAALNPSMRIGQQIAEAILLHEDVTRRVAKHRAVEMLERVGIPDPQARAGNYPHEFSGGMRQRAMIAMALSCSPKVLIADEPTTALDVTTQAQILELLRDLRAEFGLSIIFVTHDLGVVADLCDRVQVMYAGQLVEDAQVEELFARPTHPYTRALLEAMPRVSDRRQDLVSIRGTVPSIEAFPAGCRFHPRCDLATEACRSGSMPLLAIGSSHSRCIRARDLLPAEDPLEPVVGS